MTRGHASEGVLETLARWKLLREDEVPQPRSSVDAPFPQTLLRLCDAGALVGGLSVALDVRPDELMGPLCARMGGGAQRLKVLDVREGPPLLLEIEISGRAAAWEVPGTEALVERLNEAFAADPRALAVAVLGEWEASWQLWCVPKTRLPELLSRPWFQPINQEQLRAP